VEEEFKAGTAPAAPNLIVCTPTLELGIDIGDLSAVMACSVPPATANYLQRVGRGGRKTGNAFTLTFATLRPHDLYFFNSPTDMLAGQVVPPGCFLDAPEMLKRQLVAYAMDRWARAETNLPRIPRYTRQCIGDRAFPTLFLDSVRQHGTSLAADFVELFADVAGAESRDLLRAFAISGQIQELVVGAFQRIHKEVQELTRVKHRTEARLKDLEARPETSDHPADEKRELQSTVKALIRLREELLEKYPLEVLTDAGVLPNYAFRTRASTCTR
jgi:DEAD/DEAH box helicase domain-containing protein